MECDRCWKPIKGKESVKVKNGKMILRFCLECAELTGNKGV